jgi:hypothetical protein
MPDDEMEQLLRETFSEYQQSVADLLDAYPVRSDELLQGLEAATDRWVRSEFEVVTASLRRDVRFRLAMRRAARQATT